LTPLDLLHHDLLHPSGALVKWPLFAFALH